MRVAGPSSQQRALDASNATIADAIAAHNGGLWADAADVTVSHGSAVATWPARTGTAPSQGDASKQPLADRTGDGCLAFDGVNDALALVDTLSTSTACSIVIVYTPEASITGVLLEYGVTYYNTNGIVIFRDAAGPTTSGTGTSTFGNFVTSSRANLVNTRSTAAMTADRVPAPDVVAAVDNWGIVTDPMNGTYNATGNFGANTGWIGARNNGASVPFAGRIHSVVILRARLQYGPLAALTEAMHAA